MTSAAAVLVGGQVVAAILIMIGLRWFVTHRYCCLGSSTGARAVGIGASLWVLADLGSSPTGTHLLAHLRLSVGHAAVAVVSLVLLTGALFVLAPRYPIDDTHDDGGTP